MATKKETYEKEIIEVIKKNNLFIIQDIFAFYTGIKSAQFYNLELEKSESIKKAIDDNKIKTKQSMKNKWYKSDNAALQMGLMKLIGTEEEAHRLNGSKQEMKGQIETIIPQIVVTDKDTAAELDKLMKAAKGG